MKVVKSDLDHDASIIPMSCASCHEAIGALDGPISERGIGKYLMDRNVMPLCVACATIIMNPQHSGTPKRRLQVIEYLKESKHRD